MRVNRDTIVFIFVSAIESNFLFLAIIGVIFSVISAFYYLKIIKIMYMDNQDDSSSFECSLANSLALSTIISLSALSSAN